MALLLYVYCAFIARLLRGFVAASIRLQENIGIAAELFQLGDERGVDQALCADAALFALEINYHLLLAGEHGEDQLNTRKARIVLAGQLDPELGVGVCPRRLGLELAEIGYRADAVRHELRLLLVAHGYAAAHDDGRVILDVDAAGVQRALDTGSIYIKDNAPIIVRGRISMRDEKEPQLMADSIRPIADLGKLKPEPPRTNADSKLWVKLPGEDDPRLARIELILTMFPGQQQMIIYLEREKRRIGAKCLIHPSLIAELKELCGDANVFLEAN